ncbi:MAG TPA: hypothetical protein VJ501_13455 [Burkholderiaceae bacterium]|nr:hypothetical protein [Burkholderiaceae bacterium]
MASFTLTHYLIRWKREHGLDWNFRCSENVVRAGLQRELGQLLGR